MEDFLEKVLQILISFKRCNIEVCVRDFLAKLESLSTFYIKLFLESILFFGFKFEGVFMYQKVK